MSGQEPPPRPDLLSRRQAALGLVASGALLPLAGCGKPPEDILPYVEMPERLVPGVPLRFATSLPLSGYGRGVLVTSHEGRPTKVEGNPAHPASLGATDVFAEAAVLDLYDPDRSKAVREGARIASFAEFLAILQPRLAALRERGGEGLRILTGHLTSPTLLRLLGELRAAHPRMRWYAHEAVGEANARAGAELAFGLPLRALPRLERAAVVAALDADPLGVGPDQIRMGRGFAARRLARRSGTAAPPFARLYAAEPVMTTTGAKVDHRLPLSPGAARDLALALAAALGAPVSAPELPPPAARFAAALAADLRAHRGEAVVLVGEWQPPEVHALAHWINARIAAPVDHLPPSPEAAEPPLSLPDLLRDLRSAGPGDVLLVLGTNPAYDAPAALGVPEALRGAAGLTVHLGTRRNETAALCAWHLPESHPLEDWADLRAPDGTAGVAQPLIRPLHDTRSAAWLLGVLAGRQDQTAQAAVRATWAAGRPAEGFEDWWRQVLHAGVVPDSAPAPVAPPEPRLPQIGPSPAAAGLILALRPDGAVWDGSRANNAWLQECPRPITTQVWGNAALLAPEDAAARGVRDGDVVRLSLGGRSLEVPALVRPGQVPGVVLLALGGGRRRAGAIGDGIGADAYVLRRPEAPWYAPGLAVERTGREGEVLLAQAHRRLEGAEARELLPSLTLAELARREPPPPPARPSLYPPMLPRDTPAWGMVIDTTLCIGCNACVLACQSENNVPVVGPEEIARGRDMHWLRIDTYEIGAGESSRPGFQPLPCMHCEQAPCEPVCPVAASVHDSEGLNVQVYNRCVGTRFCQANCPWKVRHFNFFGYADGQEYKNLGAPLVAAQYNPDVTVRARGVMEKCTYCVQRISAARRAAEKERRGIAEGEVVTACQSACPTTAIRFGDLRRPDSDVSQLRREAQHYALLGHLGTRPRTTYLADVRNPNPDLEG